MWGGVLNVTLDLLSRSLHWQFSQVEDPGGMQSERLSVCEWLLIVWRWIACRKWVVSLCVVLYYWHGLASGGPPQDGGVVGMFWPLPSGPASGPLSI